MRLFLAVSDVDTRVILDTIQKVLEYKPKTLQTDETAL
jgi:hypothetical protein